MIIVAFLFLILGTILLVIGANQWAALTISLVLSTFVLMSDD